MFSSLAASNPLTLFRRTRRPAANIMVGRSAVLICLLAGSLVPRHGRADTPTVPQPAPAVTEALAEIAPPLSIYESCQMADNAARLIADPAPTTATLRHVDRMLNAVILYVDRIDRAHSTLPFYAWEEVSNEKAPRDGWETQIFRLLQPLPQVTALSVRVRHGDIDIKSLSAIDRNRTRWDFTQAVHVPAEQPRPEIFFLSLPTDLAEIHVTCRRSDPKTQRWPRLFIDAGVSSVPESAKQAIYYLRVARGDLQGRRMASARQHIRQASDHLREYQKNRRF